MMGTGIGIMLLSLYVHFLAIKKVNNSYGVSLPSSRCSGISFGLMFASFKVVMRACNLLSNSFICKFLNLIFGYHMQVPFNHCCWHSHYFFFPFLLEIVGEGKVANFLLGHNWHHSLRYSFIKKKMLLEVSITLLEG